MVRTWLLMCENMQLMPGSFGHYECKGQSISRAVSGITNAKGLSDSLEKSCLNHKALSVTGGTLFTQKIVLLLVVDVHDELDKTYFGTCRLTVQSNSNKTDTWKLFIHFKDCSCCCCYRYQQ